MSLDTTVYAIYMRADTLLSIEDFIEYFTRYLSRFDDDCLGFCGLSTTDIAALERQL